MIAAGAHVRSQTARVLKGLVQVLLFLSLFVQKHQSVSSDAALVGFNLVRLVGLSPTVLRLRKLLAQTGRARKPGILAGVRGQAFFDQVVSHIPGEFEY